ncbi:MAG: glycosyltransferase family 4 protein [Deltaproteobacteria bacterium]|nr:glycosyltransferase family 4 protein [Deltaproteobacteria bacterium]
MCDPGRANPKILMTAYFFPPMGGAGSLRPLKLAKYLPDCGWDPVVLTVKNPDWYYAKDPDLLKELPADVLVCRTRMIRSAWIYRLLNPSRAQKADKWIRRFLLHPDEQVGWILSAYAAALRIVRKRRVKAIYSSSAPMSCHLIAYLIKKKTGLPWIADFRDEWYENPDFDFPTIFHRRMHFKLEKMIVDSADQVITAAPGFCRLLAKHPGCAGKCGTIYMGYDPEDFPSSVRESSPSSGEGKPFTIAFSGLFYAAFRPAGILAAVSSLIDEGRIPAQNIRLLFVGANSPDETGFADRHNICRFTGFVPHRRAVSHLMASDALLLLLSRERGDYVVPSKTFEYIASGRPILAAVPAGSEVASIVRKAGTGLVVDFEDADGLRDGILELYDRWLAGTDVPAPAPGCLSFFNQKEQTRLFAEILNNITAGRETSRRKGLSS